MTAWQYIPGWFDFEDIYDLAVDEALDGAHFLEIGCWLGRSTCYLGQRIVESGKDIRLFVIDTFEGIPGDPLQDEVTSGGVSVLEQFQNNVRAAGLSRVVTVYQEDSSTAHVRFADRSLDLVFIDGDHSYEGARADIVNYAPKVKDGGVLAGHDYRDAAGVRRAVDEILGSCPASKSSWATRIG